MIIVEQGKVVEFCAEPGDFKYDTSTEPSLFAGKLGKRMIMIYAKIETCLQALIIPVFLPKNKKLLK